MYLNNPAVKAMSVALIVSQLILSGTCVAQEPDSPFNIEDTEPLEEISGIIMDKTITVKGHQFSRHFSDRLHLVAPENTENLIIFERPSPRWGNLIWVEHNNTRLYSVFWNPRIGDIGFVAEAAADQITDTLSRLRLSRLFSDTFDLEKDEF